MDCGTEISGRRRLEALPAFYWHATAQGENEYCRNSAFEGGGTLRGKPESCQPREYLEIMKTTMKESSSTALLALAALFFVPAVLILSPDGRLFFLALAALVSVIVLIAAPSRMKRTAACIGLLLAVALAIQAWPEYKANADAWRKHTSQPAEQKSK